MRRRARALVVVALAAAACGLLPTGSAAQAEAGHQTEIEALREAIALERSGRRDDAIVALHRLLDRAPTSLGALLALERTSRADDRVAEVLPRADRFLAVDPTAAGPWHLKLRVLAELDSLDALRAVARAWSEAVPDDPVPVRESARMFRRALGDEEALALLEGGMERLGPGSGLELDLGDVLGALGRFSEAGSAWARAAGLDAVDLDGLVGRLRRIGPGAAEASPPVVAALVDHPGVDHRVAAVRVATIDDAGLDPVAVARRALSRVERAGRQEFLREVADLAGEGRSPSLEAWALATLSQELPRPDAEVDARLAAVSLEVGDTATALAAHRRSASAAPRGSEARAAALASALRIEAARLDADELEARWQAYRGEFPNAADTDDLAALVAGALARRGDPDAALALADQVAGPRTRLERAWLLFEQGDVEAGAEALREALPGLAPASATEIIQLLAVIDRVRPATAGALAAAQAALHRGRPAEARAALDRALEGAPSSDRPPLLRRAAELGLERGDSAAARGHLDRLVREHDDSPEAAEAFLALARLEASRPEGVDRARELLRRLILERPQAAVVPAARRELQRLGREG